MFHRLWKWFTSTVLSRSKAEVDQLNEGSLKKLAVTGIPAALLNMLGQWTLHAPMAFYADICILVYFIIALVIIRFIPLHAKKISGTLQLYLFECLVLFISLLTGSFLDPHHAAAFLIICLMTLPVLILDMPWHIYLFTTAWLLFFVP